MELVDDGLSGNTGGGIGKGFGGDVFVAGVDTDSAGVGVKKNVSVFGAIRGGLEVFEENIFFGQLDEFGLVEALFGS